MKALTMKKSPIRIIAEIYSDLYYVNPLGVTIMTQRRVDREAKKKGSLWGEFPFLYNRTPFWKFYLRKFLNKTCKTVQDSIKKDFDMNL